MKDVRQIAVGPLDETPIPPGPVPQLAVVIPTLHEAKNIKAVLERIRSSLRARLRLSESQVDSLVREGRQSLDLSISTLL